MLNRQFKAVVAILTAIMFISLTPSYVRAIIDPILIEDGDWGGDDAVWSGPVVADIDNDGVMEIIVTDATRIIVYQIVDEDYVVLATFDLTEVGDIVLPDGDFEFRCIPSVGNVDDDDDLEIVAVCSETPSKLEICLRAIIF